MPLLPEPMHMPQTCSCCCCCGKLQQTQSERNSYRMHKMSAVEILDQCGTPDQCCLQAVAAHTTSSLHGCKLLPACRRAQLWIVTMLAQSHKGWPSQRPWLANHSPQAQHFKLLEHQALPSACCLYAPAQSTRKLSSATTAPPQHHADLSRCMQGEHACCTSCKHTTSHYCWPLATQNSS
jgi:hypothetical protein